ncbi:MAG: type IV pilus assembly protein PilV [Methylophagaceae bacterium]|jgi:type IV pilus assembly protein PilV
MMTNQIRITKSNNTGFTLLEVMIAVFVLAVGLLGLANLQMLSLKNNHSAQYRTSATILAYDIIDRMRLNRTADYTLALAATPSGSTLKDRDLMDWTTVLSNELPVGDGSIAMSGDIVTVVVQWDDSRGSEGNAAQSFTVSSER